ncbi:MAG: DUF2284 domain-containing protein [Eubacteriales bacterium]|nr:DUF2284 domain-containing protein [Eubacteriales bacterium]
MVEIDQWIAQFPVCQYEIVPSEKIPFSEKVRFICREECERYGKSWSCPPAVGSVEECRQRCLEYPRALVFTTLAEVNDMAVMAETLATRGGHEKISRAICRELEDRGYSCLCLSSESCQICESCAYPEACRHPEAAIPCVESYGILVTELAEMCGMDFYYDSHTVTWFGLIFFKDKER